jgi:hypothetical protein
MLTAGRPTAWTGRRGTVFLLQAHRASGPAAHFVGCAVDVDARLTQLRAGAARLAAVAASGDLELACTWSGGRGNAGDARQSHRELPGLPDLPGRHAAGGTVPATSAAVSSVLSMPVSAVVDAHR